MRGAPLRAAVAVVLCVGAMGCTAAAEGETVAAAQPAPAAETSEEPAPARPFDLEVVRVTLVGTDNAAILGGRGTPTDHDAAERAVAAARDVLEAFLNGQLVDEDTRFSADPLDGLLSARARSALSDDGRAGLGQVTVPVARTITGPASTVAQVLIDGDHVHAVNLSYNALLTVVRTDGSSHPAKQSGAMTFVPTEEGWRADAVEVTTELPDASP